MPVVQFIDKLVCSIDLPCTPPYCFTSMCGVIICRIQVPVNDSKILDKVGVREMGWGSDSMLLGGLDFGMRIT
jgi:hypothetical protein